MEAGKTVGGSQQLSTDPLPFARSGVPSTFSRTKDFLESGDVMREESLSHATVPCAPVEEAAAQEIGNVPYDDEKVNYFPPELVNLCSNDSITIYHCYLIELDRKFQYNIALHGVVLVVTSQLNFEFVNMNFDMEVDPGNIAAHLRYVGTICLSPEQVLLCKRFQITVFRVLLDHNLDKLRKSLDGLESRDDIVVDYLLLPTAGSHQKPDQEPNVIDWKCIRSVLFSPGNVGKHTDCCASKGHAHIVQTKNGPVCSCTLENCVVCTPHNGRVYVVSGFFLKLNSNSLLRWKNAKAITYKEYYKSRHGLELQFDNQPLLKGRQNVQVHNYLQRCRSRKEKELSKAYVELPPELCYIVMSPMSVSTLYSYSLMPTVMHRCESLLVALNLKTILLDHCMRNINIPTTKVLEAITTKRCQDNFHLESLETLGDSFLKYATTQHLFLTYQNSPEGVLSNKREEIISNAALCKLGCEHKIPGFIRNEPFDPKSWRIPGDVSGDCALTEEVISPTRKIYVSGMKKLKSKKVADVVEALIGAFLSTGGERAAILFMGWVGIEVDFANIPYVRHFPVHPERHVDLHHLESLLRYSFRDPSLLVEALTHGSYLLSGIPRSYERFEFLGDSVLDFLVTMHLYRKHPGLSPGLLTDLRSASVNNDCYALSAVKADLHRHILCASAVLQKQITIAVENFRQFTGESTFGWESVESYPKVLADIIESLAGAIFVDSGYDKEIVFERIRPLLEPLVTPETIKHNPVKELTELCRKERFVMNAVETYENGAASITLEVLANGVTHKHACTKLNKDTAKRVACREVLKSLKQSISRT